MLSLLELLFTSAIIYLNSERRFALLKLLADAVSVLCLNCHWAKRRRLLRYFGWRRYWYPWYAAVWCYCASMFSWYVIFRLNFMLSCTARFSLLRSSCNGKPSTSGTVPLRSNAAYACFSNNPEVIFSVELRSRFWGDSFVRLIYLFRQLVESNVKLWYWMLSQEFSASNEHICT